MIQYPPPSKLRCFRCSTVPPQFVLLSCYHLLCHGCLAHYRLLQKTPILTITCSCGTQSLLESSTQQLLRCSKEEVSEFSLDSTPKIMVKEVKVIDSKKRSLGSEGIEDTIDHTEMERSQLHSRPQSIKKSRHPRRDSEERKFIKEVGYFTKNHIDSSEFTKGHSEERVKGEMVPLERELRFLEMQYEKSVQDLRALLETKIQELGKVFRVCKRNLKVWYSEHEGEKGAAFNLTQYSKGRYEVISSQLDQLYSHLNSYQITPIPTTNTLSPPPPRRDHSHRRLKTQIIQTLHSHPIPSKPQRNQFHSPQFRRNRSPQYLCPHTHLMLQKHKFIKKKYQINEPFI